MATLLPARRAVCRRAAAIGCILVALALPPGAAAQKEAFADALIDLRLALAGIDGDEGPRVRDAIDRMDASLAQWDRTLAAIEGDMRQALPDAPPDRALRARTTLASLYIERGRLSDAIAEIDAAIALDAGRPAFHLLRGLVRELAGDTSEALADFHQAWTLDPGDPVTAYLLADRRLAHTRLEDVSPQIEVLLAAFGSAAAPTPPPSFIDLTLIRDTAADWPVFAPAAYVEGFAAVAAGRYGEAVERLRAAASRDPLLTDDILGTPTVARGIAARREGRVAAAIGAFEAAVAQAPRSSEALRLLAAALLAAGRHAEAIGRLEMAVRLAPADERSRLALARALARDDRWSEAEQTLRETLGALPGSADAWWMLAEVHEEQGRGHEAMRALDEAAALPMLAGRGVLYWRLAELAHVLQEYEAVTEALTARVRLDPDSGPGHKVLGLAHLRRGAPQEALLELLMASLLEPGDPATLAAVGQIHLDAGRYEAAVEVLRRTVERAPDLAQARFALGTALVRLGRTAEGQDQLAEFRRLRQAQLDAQRHTFERDRLLRQADLHTADGRHDLAVAAWEQLLLLEPEEPSHRIGLAGALAAAGDPDAAAGHLERALGMGGSPEIHRQAAAIYDRLGRSEDAARARATAERLEREQAAAPDRGR